MGPITGDGFVELVGYAVGLDRCKGSNISSKFKV